MTAWRTSEPFLRLVPPSPLIPAATLHAPLALAAPLARRAAPRGPRVHARRPRPPARAQQPRLCARQRERDRTRLRPAAGRRRFEALVRQADPVRLVLRAVRERARQPRRPAPDLVRDDGRVPPRAAPLRALVPRAAANERRGVGAVARGARAVRLLPVLERAPGRLVRGAR